MTMPIRIIDDEGLPHNSTNPIPVEIISGESSSGIVQIDQTTPGANIVSIESIPAVDINSLPSVVVTKTNSTGSAAIALSGSAANFQKFVSVTVHLSAAPTSAGNLTVTLNVALDSVYDTLLFIQNMIGITDLVYIPDGEIILSDSDSIDVAYANPDGKTYGVEITLRNL